MEEKEQDKKKRKQIGKEVRKIKEEKLRPLPEEDEAPIADEVLYDGAGDSLFLSKSVFGTQEDFRSSEIFKVSPEPGQIKKADQQQGPTIQFSARQEVNQPPTEESLAAPRREPTQEYEVDEITQLKEVEEVIDQSQFQTEKPAALAKAIKEEKPAPIAKTTKEEKPAPVAKATKEEKPAEIEKTVPVPQQAAQRQTQPISHKQTQPIPPRHTQPAEEKPASESKPASKESRRWDEGAQIRHDKSIVSPPRNADEEGPIRTERMDEPPNFGGKISIAQIPAKFWIAGVVVLILFLCTMLTVIIFSTRAASSTPAEITVQCIDVVEDELIPTILEQGFLSWDKIQNLYTPVFGQIGNLYIETGIAVKENDLLAELLDSQGKKIYSIKAPYDGEILQMSIEKGTRVWPGAKVAELASAKKVAMIPIPMAYYSKLKAEFSKSVATEIHLGKTKIIACKISELLWYQDKFYAKALPKEGDWPKEYNIGSPILAKISFAEKIMCQQIPRNSIVMRPEFASMPTVFIAPQAQGMKTSKLQLVPVLLGVGNADMVEVLDGLDSKTRVVVGSTIGMMNLAPGMKATIQNR